MQKLSEDRLVELAWIAQVRDVALPLNPTAPLLVRDYSVKRGNPATAINPHPERHPYCEISIILEGSLTAHIETQKIKRGAGSVMLVGPGIPHDAFHRDFPWRGYVVHFLPILLLEMGPQGDGARILSRFTAAQKIGDRIFSAPKNLLAEIAPRFEAMSKEFRHKEVCWELRLRALLMEILTEIFRWEKNSGRATGLRHDETNWTQMEKSLRFIHDNYTRPVYVEEMAKAVGLSVDRLQTTFRRAFGIGCIHYLQAYRITQAKALLGVPGTRVNEAALEVGFTRLSHFNTAFRRLTGVSPTQYVKKHAATRK